MKKTCNKIITGFLTAALVMGSLFYTGVPASAVEEKAVCVPLSFTGATWEDEWWNTSKTAIWNGIEKEVTYSDSFTFSFQAAVPKQVFQEETTINLNGWYDLLQGEDREFVGSIGTKFGIDWHMEGDKYVATYWDEAEQKDKDATEYASAKESGDYVIFTVKNLPMKDTMDEGGAIDTSKKGYLNACIEIGGINTKIDTVAYIDNLVVSAKGEELVNIDCSAPDLGYTGYSVNGANEVENQISDFSNEIITLEKSAVTVTAGKTAKINATTSPAAKITYASSDSKIATVSADGIVKGVKAGKATITVSANGIRKTVAVSVKADAKNPTLKVAKSSVTVKKGKKVKIKATATPKTKIKYKSSNKKVATVSSKGVVKGVKAGKAVVTVSANGISKKVKVTVKK